MLSWRSTAQLECRFPLLSAQLPSRLPTVLLAPASAALCPRASTSLSLPPRLATGSQDPVRPAGPAPPGGHGGLAGRGAAHGILLLRQGARRGGNGTDHWRRVLEVEFGSMNEALYNLCAITKSSGHAGWLSLGCCSGLAEVVVRACSGQAPPCAPRSVKFCDLPPLPPCRVRPLLRQARLLPPAGGGARPAARPAR